MYTQKPPQSWQEMTYEQKRAAILSFIYFMLTIIISSVFFATLILNTELEEKQPLTQAAEPTPAPKPAPKQYVTKAYTKGVKIVPVNDKLDGVMFELVNIGETTIQNVKADFYFYDENGNFVTKYNYYLYSAGAKGIEPNGKYIPNKDHDIQTIPKINNYKYAKLRITKIEALTEANKKVTINPTYDLSNETIVTKGNFTFVCATKELYESAEQLALTNPEGMKHLINTGFCSYPKAGLRLRLLKASLFSGINRFVVLDTGDMIWTSEKALVRVPANLDRYEL